MTGLQKTIIACLLQWSISGIAQTTSANKPDPGMFESARQLAHEGAGESARGKLVQLIDADPLNTDAAILLAQTYSWEGEHDIARKRLNRLTSCDPELGDAWLAAIRNEQYAGNPSIALGLANKALAHLKHQVEIEQIRMEILDANKPQNVQQEAKSAGRNGLSLENRIEAFNSTYEPMVYGSVEYRRQTHYGSINPRINYSHRFETNGLQYALDAYPKLSSQVYGFLTYGYSEAPTYPQHDTGAEIFLNLPRGMETSIGVRYLDLRQRSAMLLTGSFGLYRGNFFFSLRPYATFIPDRSPGFSGTILARNYLHEKGEFLGLRAAYGFTPELRQYFSGSEILAETLFFVESQEILLEYQFAGAGGLNRYRASAGAGRQEFAFESGSFFWVFRVGFRYELAF